MHESPVARVGETGRARGPGRWRASAEVCCCLLRPLECRLAGRVDDVHGVVAWHDRGGCQARDKC